MNIFFFFFKCRFCYLILHEFFTEIKSPILYTIHLLMKIFFELNNCLIFGRYFKTGSSKLFIFKSIHFCSTYNICGKCVRYGSSYVAIKQLTPNLNKADFIFSFYLCFLFRFYFFLFIFIYFLSYLQDRPTLEILLKVFFFLNSRQQIRNLFINEWDQHAKMWHRSTNIWRPIYIHHESIWEYSQVSRYDTQVTLAISSFRQLPLDIDMTIIKKIVLCVITEKKIFLLSLYKMIKQIMKALLLTSKIVAFVYTCGLKIVVYILVWPTNLAYFMMFVEILVEKILI